LICFIILRRVFPLLLLRWLFNRRSSQFLYRTLTHIHTQQVDNNILTFKNKHSASFPFYVHVISPSLPPSLPPSHFSFPAGGVKRLFSLLVAMMALTAPRIFLGGREGGREGGKEGLKGKFSKRESGQERWNVMRPSSLPHSLPPSLTSRH